MYLIIDILTDPFFLGVIHIYYQVIMYLIPSDLHILSIY